MTLRFMPAPEVLARWSDIVERLRPALNIEAGELLDRLVSGDWAAFDVNEGAGFLVGQMAIPKGGKKPAAWVRFAGGRLPGGPKQRLAAMRSLIVEFEAVARKVGCSAVRVEADRWSGILTDYHEIGRIGRNTIFQKRV